MNRRATGNKKAAGNRRVAGSRKTTGNRAAESRTGRQEGKQKNKLTLKMQAKLVWLFLIIMLAFVGLSARLIYINKEDGEEYKKQILSQQEYDSVTLPFKRGEILDAKGTKLAYSEKVYNLVVDAKLVNQDKEALEPTMKALETCFDIDGAQVRQFIVENPKNQYYVVLKRLTYDEISPFLELQKDKKKNPHIKGVWFEEEYRRVYPSGRLACDVIGFTGSDNNGTFGLEEYYNDTLNGTNGREYGYLNEDSELERTTKAAVDGNTIVTSIDSNIQSIVEKYIKQFNDEHKGAFRPDDGGSTNTGVIVMKPKTGEVLAMASYPDFDLNNPRNLTEIYSEAEIAAMDDDTMYEKLNELWRNFCISDTYEPGSTAKSITISAGLDSGKLKGNEGFYCNGVMEVGGHNIHCNKRIGHQNLDISGALEQSCNMALIEIGQIIGKETFMKYLHNFNFGLKTNIDLAGEARTDTLLYDVNEMVPSDLAISSFGQGYNVTMIELASAFCSIINGGYYYQPHVVTEILDANGTTVQKIEPRVLKETISESVSEKMRGYLANVCTVGTGKTAVPAGYLIGGKTGTAEKYPRKTGNYVVSFIGFAPVNDPEVVVYVVIDEPNVEDQPHSSFAQEVARNIFTELLPYMNIFRTEELSEEEQAELEALGIIHTVSGNEIEGEEENDPAAGYETDPETGYLIEPGTGYFIDPNTYEYVDPTISMLE